MQKYFTALFGTLILILLANGVHAGQTASPSRTLKMQVHYTGTGTVDEKHKIFVFLFNSTDFMEGDGQPIATGSTTSKDETVTFPDLNDSPIYAAVAYDPNGDYDGRSQPPSGSSTAIYSKTPNVPDPITIEAGKTVEVTFTFDDTHKMR